MNSELYQKYDQHTVQAGTVIFQEHDAADGMYVIVKGRVTISKHVMTGLDKTLTVLEEGEYFGEMSLLLNASRSATATALEDTVLIKLGRHEFKQLLRESPDTGMTMLIQLAERLDKSTNEGVLLALELALAEQRPPDYSSQVSPYDQIFVVTGHFNAKDMSEVMLRTKELHWTPKTRILANLFQVGQGEHSLLYIIQTPESRDVMKLVSCVSELVQWKISLATQADDGFLDTFL